MSWDRKGGGSYGAHGPRGRHSQGRGPSQSVCWRKAKAASALEREDKGEASQRRRNAVTLTR